MMFKALELAGVSRDLVYNRAALMLLAAGIGKGKGVERMLRSLGLSFQDALALGDAENDLAPFDACAWAACPENAVPEVKARADWVFSGQNGESVAAAIAGPIILGLLSARHSPRHRIAVGWIVETSEPATIPARDVNVLIHGDPFSVKSRLVGVLIERLLTAHYAVCVLDPEEDRGPLAPRRDSGSPPRRRSADHFSLRDGRVVLGPMTTSESIDTVCGDGT